MLTKNQTQRLQEFLVEHESLFDSDLMAPTTLMLYNLYTDPHENLKLTFYPVFDVSKKTFRVHVVGTTPVINTNVNIPTHIYFTKHTDSKTANKVLITLTKILFEINSKEVFNRRVSFLETEKKETDKLQKRSMAKLIAEIPPEVLVENDEVCQALQNIYGAAISDNIANYKYNPGVHNLDIKYTTSEIIDILIEDLKNYIKRTKHMEELKDLHESSAMTVQIIEARKIEIQKILESSI